MMSSLNTTPPAAAPLLDANDARPAPGAFVPVLVWMLVLLGALLLPVLRVPLSARFPVPAERIALHEMLVVQTIASAMLFPLLLRSLVSTLMTVGLSVIFAELAAFLAGEDISRPMMIYVAWPALWIVGLWGWLAALRTRRAQMAGVAAAVLLSAGGAVLAYLSREFGDASQSFPWGGRGWMGPTIGAIAMIETRTAAGTIWYGMGLHLLLGALGGSLGLLLGRRKAR